MAQIADESRRCLQTGMTFEQNTDAFERALRPQIAQDGWVMAHLAGMVDELERFGCHCSAVKCMIRLSGAETGILGFDQGAAGQQEGLNPFFCALQAFSESRWLNLRISAPSLPETSKTAPRTHARRWPRSKPRRTICRQAMRNASTIRSCMGSASSSRQGVGQSGTMKVAISSKDMDAQDQDRESPHQAISSFASGSATDQQVRWKQAASPAFSDALNCFTAS